MAANNIFFNWNMDEVAVINNVVVKSHYSIPKKDAIGMTKGHVENKRNYGKVVCISQDYSICVITRHEWMKGRYLMSRKVNFN